MHHSKGRETHEI